MLFIVLNKVEQIKKSVSHPNYFCTTHFITLSMPGSYKGMYLRFSNQNFQCFSVYLSKARTFDCLERV